MSDRVFTIPNLISMGRIGLVPVFMVLFLTARDWAALTVLFVMGNSDWVDGMVARKTGQVSELGKILDPISDRIAIVAVLLAITLRGGLIPFWLTGAILGRELVIGIAFAILEARGAPRIAVNRVGKLATLSIFSGMGFTVISLVVAGKAGDNILTVALVILTLGAALYWVATAMYFIELRKRLRQEV